jgi:hypothetical protein
MIRQLPDQITNDRCASPPLATSAKDAKVNPEEPEITEDRKDGVFFTEGNEGLEGC